MYRSIIAAWFMVTVARAGEAPAYPPPTQVRAAFLKLLDRPRPPADPAVVAVKPAQPEGWVLEDLRITSEIKSPQASERVPISILRPADKKGLPAVIVLHGTGGNREGMLPFMKELAERGIIAVAIDARYHGARTKEGKGSAAYNAAVLRAWQTKAGAAMEHPFYYDTCWDLWRLIDYLETRPEIDARRLGMIGFSMGGIQTWLAASVDERVKVIVPAIAVQSFRWSLENDQWQGRARTIKLAHEGAARDLGEPEVNAKVCRALWQKIVPGIVDQFDCPSMLRLCAPRPLLIPSGTKDANCPYGGAKLAIASAQRAYQEAGATDRLQVTIAEVGHTVTPEQRKAAADWFERWLTK